MEDVDIPLGYSTRNFKNVQKLCDIHDQQGGSLKETPYCALHFSEIDFSCVVKSWSILAYLVLGQKAQEQSCKINISIEISITRTR